MPRDDATLLDIVYAARLIQDFSLGMDKAIFLTDLKTQSAVLHQMLILGEAVKRLSKESRDANPQIPWSQIARMRDRIIHHYDAVDLSRVWAAIESDIPEMLIVLTPLLPQKPGPADL